MNSKMTRKMNSKMTRKMTRTNPCTISCEEPDI